MQPKMTISRAVIYAALILFALYFLFPIYVMLSTSFKDIDQLRTGNLLTPPTHWTIDPWIKAWSGACTGVRCDGMQPFFMNSVRMVIPAVLISSIIGAFNGYVLTHWRFRGADPIFTMLLVGCFIPFQAILLPMARFEGITRPVEHDHRTGGGARDLRHRVHHDVLPQLLRQHSG